LKNKKIPMRMCAGCRESKPKAELVRIVRTPDGSIKLDLTGKMSGRGTYICYNKECFEKSIKTKALSRALDAQIDEAVVKALEEEINEKRT